MARKKFQTQRKDLKTANFQRNNIFKRRKVSQAGGFQEKSTKIETEVSQEKDKFFSSQSLFFTNSKPSIGNSQKFNIEYKMHQEATAGSSRILANFLKRKL